MEKPNVSSHSAQEFKDWNELGALIITPKFQRREVWKTPARSYFIESLLCGIPIPPIFLRLRQSEDKKRVVREVIDGQQRLRSLLEFMEGKYALSRSMREHGGKKFSDLPQSAQQKIETFTFLCEVFQQISDEDVLEVFARVNTYAVALNDQELRNGKFFGRFKQTAYELAHEHLEFWREHKVFSETSIARMLEVELTSELMIAILAGQQDKKKSINGFYAKFDDTFPEEKRVRARFSATADEVTDALENDLKDSEFRRVPLFYTLFCVLLHRLFGVPGEDLPTPKRKKLTLSEQTRLKDAVIELSETLQAAKSGTVSKNDLPFVTACLRQTDNLQPRQIRFKELYTRAFSL